MDRGTSDSPPASLTEPAVLHAVLALSSTHWDGSLQYRTWQRRASVAPDKLEKFAWQHPNQAIQHLRAGFAPQEQVSSRVAIITCLVFISDDLLRGNFGTAQFHLHSGLKLIAEEQMFSVGAPGGSPRSTDDWILEMFSRLYIQSELFNQSYQPPPVFFAPGAFSQQRRSSQPSRMLGVGFNRPSFQPPIMSS
ncbi:hypothetical protein CNMCM5793_009615 [Aspergillus hiratsukae]|uniref:Transcription factor domain-containing protein n=1 Tax=Aspergillus hiratsukae TaxID=1194566 RepID=A0A8H6P121_9EURO|nr:hypothetical protein CNMCM5793_009615 [Aspergillus hiratsukae]KAF7168692.1 hypothetical protein CNMCM6106_003810 [Aspergillus hiratsukae]